MVHPEAAQHLGIELEAGAAEYLVDKHIQRSTLLVRWHGHQQRLICASRGPGGVHAAHVLGRKRQGRAHAAQYATEGAAVHGEVFVSRQWARGNAFQQFTRELDLALREAQRVAAHVALIDHRIVIA